MTTLLPSGEKRGQNVMFGKLPSISWRPGFQIEQIHARLARDVGHVGDHLRGRIEARRQHQIAAVGEEVRIGAVLIHHGQALLAVERGPDSEMNTMRVSK